MTEKEARINPETGLADSPIHPCYKAKGLCKLRIFGNSVFECVRNPEVCHYRKIRANN